MKRQFGNLSDAIILTTVPVVADIPDVIGAGRWVYYCVDDFSAWPGLDAAPMQEMEEKLVRRADLLIAAGENLAERLGVLGRRAEVLTHGIDLEHWVGAKGDTSLLNGLPEPIVLFWGLVDRRLDMDMLAALDRAMQSGCIALIGPQQDPDPRLARMPRVRLMGPASYADLPALAQRAAVLVMPYADLPVTRAMQPLKLKEYLATGRPTVVSRLPATRDWEDCMDVALSHDQFAAQVLARIDAQTPASQLNARSRLRAEAWKSKSERMAQLLFCQSNS
ncbi:MAG: glycosyltransferase [Steroidobacteraceae bacterium]